MQQSKLSHIILVRYTIKYYSIRKVEQFFNIMLKQVTFEKVIHIIWFSVALTFCWPLPANSTKNQVFVFRILQIISIINAFMLILPLLYSIYLHFNDIAIVFQSLSILVGLSQMIIQTVILCFVKYNSLQVSLYLFHLFSAFHIKKIIFTLDI